MFQINGFVLLLMRKLNVTVKFHAHHKADTSLEYLVFAPLVGLSLLKLFRKLCPWMKGGESDFVKPPNGCTLLKSTTWRMTFVKWKEAPINWFWAMAISWIFPQEIGMVSKVLVGSHPYTFKDSWEPANKHSPFSLKEIHLQYNTETQLVKCTNIAL